MIFATPASSGSACGGAVVARQPQVGLRALAQRAPAPLLRRDRLGLEYAAADEVEQRRGELGAARLGRLRAAAARPAPADRRTAAPARTRGRSRRRGARASRRARRRRGSPPAGTRLEQQHVEEAAQDVVERVVDLVLAVLVLGGVAASSSATIVARALPGTTFARARRRQHRAREQQPHLDELLGRDVERAQVREAVARTRCRP